MNLDALKKNENKKEVENMNQGTEITRNNPYKNTVELKKMINEQGTALDVIYVDGQPFINIGYVSESDKQACINAVQTAVDTSASLIEAKMKLQNCCELSHAGIDPDEEVKFEGVDLPVMISYKERKAYIGLEEVASLEDLNLPSVGKEVVLALLTDRVKLYWQQKLAEQDTDDYDDDEDCGCPCWLD